MTDLVKVTDSSVIVGAAGEVAKLNVGGGVYLFNAVDDFIALKMRPNVGNKATRIQISGDDGVIHSEILFIQVAPTGSGTPTDSRIEFKTMDGGTLATRMLIDESKNVGIGNTNPAEALDVSGKVRIRGTSTDNTWDGGPGQLALKTGVGGGEWLGITFHEDDGDRIATIQADADVMSIAAGEDAGSTQLNISTNGALRMVVDEIGNVGIGGYSSLIDRPILGPLHVRTDTFATGFLFSESQSGMIGASPVILIDKEDATGVGVNFVATGIVLIKSTDNVFCQGAFISVKDNATQVVTLDGSNSITFEVVTGSCQLTVYRSAGSKAYFVAFMGMYT